MVQTCKLFLDFEGGASAQRRAERGFAGDEGAACAIHYAHIVYALDLSTFVGTTYYFKAEVYTILVHG